jgi:hypothetical protein
LAFSSTVQPILPSAISSSAMSAAPRPTVSAINGRLCAPPPLVSWRTRFETMFTKVFGLLTFSKALLQYSLFKVLYFAWKSKQTGNVAVKLMFAMEILLPKSAQDPVQFWLTANERE